MNKWSYRIDFFCELNLIQYENKSMTFFVFQISVLMIALAIATPIMEIQEKEKALVVEVSLVTIRREKPINKILYFMFLYGTIPWKIIIWFCYDFF